VQLLQTVPVEVTAASIQHRLITLTYLLENIMFAYLLEKLGSFFERAEQRRRTDYLASSSDLAELERRMRSLEKNGYPN
jgi:hypothetical protein